MLLCAGPAPSLESEVAADLAAFANAEAAWGGYEGFKAEFEAKYVGLAAREAEGHAAGGQVQEGAAAPAEGHADGAHA